MSTSPQISTSPKAEETTEPQILKSVTKGRPRGAARRPPTRARKAGSTPSSSSPSTGNTNPIQRKAEISGVLSTSSSGEVKNTNEITASTNPLSNETASTQPSDDIFDFSVPKPSNL